ncbi:hypothetical protein GOBAR_DD09724 [Gossypium barbadense]|nr:hypothetical protein GOBAR_DD09724 [Gossypium barbadense]
MLSSNQLEVPSSLNSCSLTINLYIAVSLATLNVIMRINHSCEAASTTQASMQGTLTQTTEKLRTSSHSYNGERSRPCARETGKAEQDTRVRAGVSSFKLKGGKPLKANPTLQQLKFSQEDKFGGRRFVDNPKEEFVFPQPALVSGQLGVREKLGFSCGHSPHEYDVVPQHRA